MVKRPCSIKAWEIVAHNVSKSPWHHIWADRRYCYFSIDVDVFLIMILKGIACLRQYFVTSSFKM